MGTPAREVSRMNCPKCTAGMETVAFEGTEIERCNACHGLWFDALEHEDLRLVKGSEALDDGLREVGRAFDAVPPAHCPACGGNLVRMVDSRQSHLWFESCVSCHGVFFDAGEFRDYKTVDWLDRLKDLWRGERR